MQVYLLLMAAAHLARIQRTWLADPWIRLSCKKCLDDFSLVLKHCTRQGRLAAVIEAVGVSAVLEEKRDEGSVAVVGCQHYLSRGPFVSIGEWRVKKIIMAEKGDWSISSMDRT